MRTAEGRAQRAAALAATHDERVAAWKARVRSKREGRLTDRFWSKVDTSGECWTWTADLDDHGYGRLGIGRKRIEPAHRVAWTLANGPIPEGLRVLHHCDNPPCVRPDHLFLGTQADNMADMMAKGRARNAYRDRTHCPQGHPYDEANTYRPPLGGRQCRACNRVRDRGRNAEKLRVRRARRRTAA